jgi:hypothetical protein
MKLRSLKVTAYNIPSFIIKLKILSFAGYHVGRMVPVRQNDSNRFN